MEKKRLGEGEWGKKSAASKKAPAMFDTSSVGL